MGGAATPQIVAYPWQRAPSVVGTTSRRRTKSDSSAGAGAAQKPPLSRPPRVAPRKKPFDFGFACGARSAPSGARQCLLWALFRTESPF
jgi:hypothetical protein